MATFAQLKSRVSSRLKDPNNTAVSEDDVAYAINSVISTYSRSVFDFNQFQESVTLVVDDPVLPALTTSVERIFTKNGIVIDYSNQKYDLTKISSSNYDSIDSEASGLPYAWTYRNSQYELYYYPNIAYTAIVRGIKQYSDLSDGTDTNDFTDNAENLIMYGALAKLYAEFRQDEKMEKYYHNREKKEKIDLLSSMQTRHRTGSIEVE